MRSIDLNRKRDRFYRFQITIIYIENFYINLNTQIEDDNLNIIHCQKCDFEY